MAVMSAGKWDVWKAGWLAEKWDVLTAAERAGQKVFEKVDLTADSTVALMAALMV
jgi:hypothetical protein